ncbi:hypothetical protein BU15DRAFT_62521 [Melanogaster broomeanus]|nr:hypothetical protein BU15DRAFT_62521 [Melanogaster broomeanus]
MNSPYRCIQYRPLGPPTSWPSWSSWLWSPEEGTDITPSENWPCCLLSIIIRFANATLPLPSCNDAAFIVASALANAGLRLILAIANASRPHICALDEIFALKESRTTTCHYQCGTTEDTLQQRNEVTHDARQAAAPRDGHAPDVAPNHPIPPTYKIPDEREYMPFSNRGHGVLEFAGPAQECIHQPDDPHVGPTERYARWHAP